VAPLCYVKSAPTQGAATRRFLAFLRRLGDRPHVGHRRTAPTEGSGAYLGPLSFCRADGAGAYPPAAPTNQFASGFHGSAWPLTSFDSVGFGLGLSLEANGRPREECLVPRCREFNVGHRPTRTTATLRKFRIVQTEQTGPAAASQPGGCAFQLATVTSISRRVASASSKVGTLDSGKNIEAIAAKSARMAVARWALRVSMPPDNLQKLPGSRS
jgi:hypothetical protein